MPEYMGTYYYYLYTHLFLRPDMMKWIKNSHTFFDSLLIYN